MSEIKKIEYYWDTTDASDPGWYAMARDDENEIVDDSMKVWFGVDVDNYTEGQGESLGAALSDAYPGAEIVAL